MCKVTKIFKITYGTIRQKDTKPKGHSDESTLITLRKNYYMTKGCFHKRKLKGKYTEQKDNETK